MNDTTSVPGDRAETRAGAALRAAARVARGFRRALQGRLASPRRAAREPATAGVQVSPSGQPPPAPYFASEEDTLAWLLGYDGPFPAPAGCLGTAERDDVPPG